MGFEVIGDQAGMWKQSVSSCASALNALGIDDMADSIQKAVAAMDLLEGTSKIIALAASLMAIDNTRKTTEAVGEVAANTALGPVGWANIAMATAIAVGVSSAMYVWQHNSTLKANLSNPSDVKAVSGMIGALVS